MLYLLFNSYIALTAARADAAAEIDLTPTVKTTSVDNATGLDVIVQNVGSDIVGALALAAGTIALLFIIWYGIQYILSAGDAKKVEAARSGIVNAVIGIAIIVASYAIIRIAVGIGNSISNAA